ncbi:hypothetical protein [Xanthomonas fragariae]|uniref:hypothetical protein n=1 Tax=Xanthomonas fragariae TaxID=48664 RepID=UPI0022AAA2B1|nr:hypothetical protein [Xanthomonas fragariae]WAT14540.1 hypothetical protein OZ429_16355 [Xanthomonas fragariae]
MENSGNDNSLPLQIACMTAGVRSAVRCNVREDVADGARRAHGATRAKPAAHIAMHASNKKGARGSLFV